MVQAEHTSVGTLPETIAASGTKVEDVVIFGVKGEPLSSSSPWHVAAHLDKTISPETLKDPSRMSHSHLER